MGTVTQLVNIQAVIANHSTFCYGRRIIGVSEVLPDSYILAPSREILDDMYILEYRSFGDVFLSPHDNMSIFIGILDFHPFYLSDKFLA